MKAPAKNGRAPVVSVIIPVYNKCGLTLQCLESLEKVRAHTPFEVVVVDNASSDGTATRVAAAAPGVSVIVNQTNFGFAHACNRGAAEAKGKYLLFLNNDTIALPGWMDELVRELQTNTGVAAVGSKLLYASGLIQHAGVAFGRESRSPYHPYRMLHADDPRVNRRREVSAVTAACMLVRANWFQECNGFSEDYRNGYEDLDLCLTIRRHGGIIVYQPRSTVIHLESQTPGRFGHDEENRAKFFRKWKDALLSDEDAFYLQDDYRVVSPRPNYPEAPQLARVQSEAERLQWSLVAKVQRLAAEWKREEVCALLEQVEAWPNDYRVRRWAGVLSHKLKLADAARSHLRVAQSLSADPELDSLLALEDKCSSGCAVAPYHQAVHAAREGKLETAQDYLESALQEGAPLKLVIPAMTKCLRASGAMQEMKVVALAAKNLRLTSAEAVSPLSRGTLESNSCLSPEPQGLPAATSASRLTSIIILVRDELQHTQTCLQSLQDHTPENHELILIDNGSSPQTADWLRNYAKTHENVTLVRNESNRGFAAGNNQGLALSRGETILLLNNDTVVTPGWLRAMLDALHQHPRVGIAGPRSNRVAGVQLVPEPGYKTLHELDSFAASWARQHAGQSRITARIIGFCMLLNRAVLDAIGGLDERFGSGNFEDDDYCIRASFAGFGAVVVDDSFVHHVGGQTFRGCGIDYRASMLKNWDLFKSKWGIPAAAAIEQGYRMPSSIPAGTQIKAPTAELQSTHDFDAQSRIWRERKVASDTARLSAAAITLPDCARLGELSSARGLLRSRDYSKAWAATMDALALRPHHPEAYLLLAEIALAVVDGHSARACAQHARSLAPSWKPAKKMLKSSFHGRNHPEWLVLPKAVGAGESKQQPRISVCLITRNEERFLAQCLNSVKGLASQIVVVDTGSTDRTKAIARECGAEVHDFKWCDDFSAARNEALKHAKCDWVLMLDADEELVSSGRDALLRLAKNKDVIAWRLPLFDAGREDEGCNYVPRFFRNAPGLFYVGRIHEQVFSSIEVRRAEWGLENRLGDATIRHHGYTAELLRDRNKVERNLRLLELALAEMPDESNLIMNYGLELVRSGRAEEGLQQYQRAFEVMSRLPDQLVVPEARETLLAQYCTQLTAAGRYADIVAVLESPLARAGKGLSAGLHFTLGLAFMKLSRFEDCAREMRQCIAKRNLPALIPQNKEIQRAGPRHCLAVALSNAKQTDEATRVFQEALAEDPASFVVRLDYAKFLAQNGQPVEALQLLHALSQERPEDASVWVLGGQIALSHPEFLEVACDWTEEALSRHQGNAQLRSQRAEVLLLTSRPDHALELIRSLPAGAQSSNLACLILCQNAVGQEAPAVPAEVEPMVSSEFIKWYQRLVRHGAAELVLKLNANLAGLRQSLPSAARLLESAIAEAAHPGSQESN